MTIFDWHNHRLPAAKAYSADGEALRGNIHRIDTRSGCYEYYKLNLDREIFVYRGEIASGWDWAAPPIRIEWSCSRFLYRVEMRWHSFMLAFAVFRRTGRWPRRRQTAKLSA